MTVGKDRVLQRHPVLLAEPEVVLAEGERRVHEPGPVLGGDEVAEQHRMAERTELRAGDIFEGRFVADARERLTGEVG